MMPASPPAEDTAASAAAVAPPGDGAADGAADPALAQLLARLSGPDGEPPPWQRLVLSKPSAAGGAQRRVLRPVRLKGVWMVQEVTQHATRDDTRNDPPAVAVHRVARALAGEFRHAHLRTATHEGQLLLGRRGRGRWVERALAPAAAAQPGSGGDVPPEDEAHAHDRAKHRMLAPDRPFLAALGVTDGQGRVVPAMAGKWRQINRFLEIFAAALARSPLAGARTLRVVDFGAGKAYLSFAVHDWLRAQGIAAEVTAVELREDLVAQGQAVVAALGLVGMHVVQGDLRSHAPAAADAMIALHACDTATDHALALGIAAGATLLVCSPCCHRELRAQRLGPAALAGLHRHGIHAEQQAEMVTDSLRALLLEAEGYDTQVFEFVSLEHTRKNKMILGVRRAAGPAAARPRALAQLDELKRFFGVRRQCLEELLARQAAAPG